MFRTVVFFMNKKVNEIHELLIRLFCVMIVVFSMYLCFANASCEEPETKLRLVFKNVTHGSKRRNLHIKDSSVFATFGNVEYFVHSDIDFKISDDIEEDELFSVILMKQTQYARLEPDGDTRLKWFVANIRGENLTKGKSHWDGQELAEFESIDDRNDDLQEYYLLWIFRHVDNETLLEDPIDDHERDGFALQTFYDFLCSRPFVEVVFAFKAEINDIKNEISTVKRLQN